MHLIADAGVASSNPSSTTFMEIDHEIIFMVILPFLLIFEGQLSVIGENMCTNTG